MLLLPLVSLPTFKDHFFTHLSIPKDCIDWEHMLCFLLVLSVLSSFVSSVVPLHLHCLKNFLSRAYFAHSLQYIAFFFQSLSLTVCSVSLCCCNFFTFTTLFSFSGCSASLFVEVKTKCERWDGVTVRWKVWKAEDSDVIASCADVFCTQQEAGWARACRANSGQPFWDVFFCCWNFSSLLLRDKVLVCFSAIWISASGTFIRITFYQADSATNCNRWGNGLVIVSTGKVVFGDELQA